MRVLSHTLTIIIATLITLGIVYLLTGTITNTNVYFAFGGATIGGVGTTLYHYHKKTK